MYRLLKIMADDLPTILRQIESKDPILNAAARERLRDLVSMTAPLRSGKKVSRRQLLRGAGVVSFAAMSIKRDD